MKGYFTRLAETGRELTTPARAVRPVEEQAGAADQRPVIEERPAAEPATPAPHGQERAEEAPPVRLIAHVVDEPAPVEATEPPVRLEKPGPPAPEPKVEPAPREPVLASEEASAEKEPAPREPAIAPQRKTRRASPPAPERPAAVEHPPRLEMAAQDRAVEPGPVEPEPLARVEEEARSSLPIARARAHPSRGTVPKDADGGETVRPARNGSRIEVHIGSISVEVRPPAPNPKPQVPGPRRTREPAPEQPAPLRLSRLYWKGW